MLRVEADLLLRNDILERMNCNLIGLAETVENVMEFAHDGLGEDCPFDENVETADLLDELAPMMAAANRGKGLAIGLDLEAAPAVIRTRRRAFRAIIANLASNAIKFTPSGSISIQLSRAHLKGREAVSLSVKDSGPGIPPAMVEHAFHPMVQLSHSNTREHRGLGLGLAIVRRKVRALGGSIHVSSEPGWGSVVTVVIPCGIPALV